MMIPELAELYPKKDIKDVIKEAREKKDLTQKQLGNMLLASDGAVNKWESGINLPTPQNIRDFCPILELDERQMFRLRFWANWRRIVEPYLNKNERYHSDNPYLQSDILTLRKLLLPNTNK